MKQFYLKPSLVYILVFTLLGCGSVKKANLSNGEKWQPEYRVQVGINHGGIVENTDMSVVENAEVDALSGATKIGYNAGAHVLFPIIGHYIETGVDYMVSNQTLKFNDVINGYYGDRDIKTSQIMLPVTFNFGFIRSKYPDGLFQLKLGYALQYNFVGVSDMGNNLPKYTIKSFSGGFNMGIASVPFRFNNGSGLGFYLDMYRGTQIYDDYYNSSSYEMPGSSFAKGGIIFQF